MGKFKAKKRTGARKEARRRSGGGGVLSWLLRVVSIPPDVPVRPGLLVEATILDSSLQGTLRTWLGGPLEDDELEECLRSLIEEFPHIAPSTVICERPRLKKSLEDWARRTGVVVEVSPQALSPFDFRTLELETIKRLPAPDVLPGREAEAYDATEMLVDVVRRYDSLLPIEMEFEGEGVRPRFRFGRLFHRGDAFGELLLGPSRQAVDEASRLLDRGWEAACEGASPDPNAALSEAVLLIFDSLDDLDSPLDRVWLEEGGCEYEAVVPETHYVTTAGSILEVHDLEVHRGATLILEAAASALSERPEMHEATEFAHEVSVGGARLTVRCSTSLAGSPAAWRVPFRTLTSPSGANLLGLLGVDRLPMTRTPLLVVEADGEAAVDSIASGPAVDALFADGHHVALLLEDDQLVHVSVGLVFRDVFAPGRMACVVIVQSNESGGSREITAEDVASWRLVPILQGPPPSSGSLRAGIEAPDGYRRPPTTPAPEDLLVAHPPLQALYTEGSDEDVARFIRMLGLRLPTSRISWCGLPGLLAAGLCMGSPCATHASFMIRSLVAARVTRFEHVPDGWQGHQGAPEEPLARVLAGTWGEDDSFTPTDPEAGALRGVAIPRARQAQPEGFLPGPGLALVAETSAGPLLVDGARASDQGAWRLDQLLQRAPWRVIPEGEREPFRTLWLLDALATTPLDTYSVGWEDSEEEDDDDECVYLVEAIAENLAPNPIAVGAESVSLGALAALSADPTYLDLYRLVLHHTTRGLLSPQFVRDLPPESMLANLLAVTLGRVSSGEPAEHLSRFIEVGGEESVAERMLAHALMVWDFWSDKDHERTVLLLTVARLGGFIDRCPPLERHAEEADLKFLRRAATALGVAVSHLAPAHLPMTIGALCALPNVGDKSLAALTRLAEESIWAGAARAGEEAEEATAGELVAGLDKLHELFADTTAADSETCEG